jgi:carboxypeptidase C (cathepsin A)
MPRSIFLAIFLTLTTAALAQRHPGGPGGPPEPATAPSTAPSEHGPDKLSVTHHSITINGAAIDYEATAGTLTLKDEAGKPRADFFFVAYVKQPADQTATRPITFVFNGGPGAAAVWLHLGDAGPYRVKLQDDGIPGPPPHSLIVNDQTWLDLTDLVFIDPVGTGFSRPAEGKKGDEFYGVQQDLDSVGDFIRLYLTRYQRWDSPKFLAGESYGTTRAAGLSYHLMSRYGIDLNGIILISTVLNLQTLSPSDGNDLPYALYLPSFASIAMYHHKVSAPDPDKLRDEVAHYAMGDYLAALAQGSALSKSARQDVVDHLARYTGLPADLIDKSNLRIDPTVFRQQLLNDQRLILGRFDARITGENPDPADQDAEYDPSLSLYLPVYSSTFNDYVRRELKFESDLPYEVLNGRIGPWDFGKEGMGYLDVTHWLREAMLGNPHLRVLVAAGYDDLATPFLAADYTFDHLDPTGRLRSNVTQTFYPSGHMIYHDPASLVKLKQDIATFMAAAK